MASTRAVHYKEIAFVWTTIMTIEQAFAAWNDRRFDLVFDLLRPIAEQGNPDAQALLGSLYEFGLGTATDLETAKYWYLLASEQGSAIASNNLAGIFAREGEHKVAGHYYELARQQDLAQPPEVETSDQEDQ
jgi:TPR repeat protein